MSNKTRNGEEKRDSPMRACPRGAKPTRSRMPDWRKRSLVDSATRKCIGDARQSRNGIRGKKPDTSRYPNVICRETRALLDDAWILDMRATLALVRSRIDEHARYHVPRLNLLPATPSPGMANTEGTRERERERERVRFEKRFGCSRRNVHCEL